MSDLLAQQLSPFQTGQMPAPATIASTTTIAPTTFITYLSGTTNVATITPFVTGAHMLVIIPTNSAPGQLVTTGNILVGSTTLAQNVPVLLFYGPALGKYFVK